MLRLPYASVVMTMIPLLIVEALLEVADQEGARET
jgi:hypothetical protein